MDQLLGGIVGIILVILGICITISWILFPIWIYCINENLKDIKVIMLRRKGEKK